MTLRKSSSRPITVNGEAYRWTFADNVDVWNVTIQRAVGEGQKLVLSWPTHPQKSLPSSITPSMIASAIQQAMTAGWTPSVEKPPLFAGFKDHTLHMRDLT